MASHSSTGLDKGGLGPSAARRSTAMKVGAMRPMMMTIKSARRCTPSLSPMTAVPSLKARASRWNIRLAAKKATRTMRNIKFLRLFFEVRTGQRAAVSAGISARSASAAIQAGSAAASHMAARPAAHAPTMMLSRRPLMGRPPLHVGVAERRNPQTAAKAKPKTISWPCQMTGWKFAGFGAASKKIASQALKNTAP